MNVFIVGKVSSGKSSLLNSIVGGFITGTSLLRDTVKVTKYKLSQNGKKSNLKFFVDNLHNENEYKQEFLSKNMDDVLTNDMTTTELPIWWKFSKKMPDIYIYDFPGFDDSKDSNKAFFTKFEKMYTEADLVLYVTDINSAFRDASEIALFGQIRNLINIHNSKGNFIGLNVVLNKYDDPDDNDHGTICDDVCKLLKNDIYLNCKINLDDIYRYSSHKTFIFNAVLNNIEIYFSPPTIKDNSEIKNNIQKKSIKKNKNVINSEFENKILKHLDSFGYNIEYPYESICIITSKEKISIDAIEGDYDNLIRTIFEKYHKLLPIYKSDSIHEYNKNLIYNIPMDEWYLSDITEDMLPKNEVSRIIVRHGKHYLCSGSSKYRKLLQARMKNLNKMLCFKTVKMYAQTIAPVSQTRLDITILTFIALNIQAVQNESRFILFEILYDHLTKSKINLDKLLGLIIPHIEKINYYSLYSLYQDYLFENYELPSVNYMLLLEYFLFNPKTYTNSHIYTYRCSTVQLKPPLIEQLKISAAPKLIRQIYDLYPINIKDIVAMLYLVDVKDHNLSCPYYSSLYQRFIANLKYVNYSITVKKNDNVDHVFWDLFKPFYNDEHKKLMQFCEKFAK